MASVLVATKPNICRFDRVPTTPKWQAHCQQVRDHVQCVDRNLMLLLALAKPPQLRSTAGSDSSTFFTCFQHIRRHSIQRFPSCHKGNGQLQPARPPIRWILSVLDCYTSSSSSCTRACPRESSLTIVSGGPGGPLLSGKILRPKS